MFSTELKFASDCLLVWFYKKHMKLELGNEEKVNYKTSNALDSEKDRCFICDFLLELRIKGANVSESEMTYSDFIIRKEHIFSRNIFSNGEINKSEKIKNLENYYESFALFLTSLYICSSIQSAINNYSSFDEIINYLISVMIVVKILLILMK